MIKSKNTLDRGIEIDLTGPQGNAYYLLGTAKNFCKQLNLKYGPIADDMTSGDYDHLVEVFDKHFGTFVTLYK